ncbi:hypothetical protein GIB67_021711, partial [Kingdonia uniflora]
MKGNVLVLDSSIVGKKVYITKKDLTTEEIERRKQDKNAKLRTQYASRLETQKSASILNFPNPGLIKTNKKQLQNGNDMAIAINHIGTGQAVAAKNSINNVKKDARMRDIDGIHTTNIRHIASNNLSTFQSSITAPVYHSGTSFISLHGAGVILCIEKTLAQSKVAKEDVNYINAHATSAQVGEMKEYKALIRSFGKNPEPRVNSTKSMIGHLLGASGVVEAVVTVQILIPCTLPCLEYIDK